MLTKQEMEVPAPPGRWSGSPPPGWKDRPRAWSDRLTGELLDDLQAWNDSLGVDDPWDEDEAVFRMFQERGRELAVRVQDELVPCRQRLPR